MFFSNIDIQGEEELKEYFYPSKYFGNGTYPLNYINTTPYKLILSTLCQGDTGLHLVTSNLSPHGSLYSSLPLDMLQLAQSSKRLHKHDFIEFMFVLDGEIYVNIENQRHLYTKGSCCILNRKIRHSEEFNTEYRVLFLQISYDFLNAIYADFSLDFFDIADKNIHSDLMEFLKLNLSSKDEMEKDYVDFIPNRNDNELIKTMHDFFDLITKETLDPGIKSSLTIKYVIIELFRHISVLENYSTTPVRIGTDAEHTLYHQIVKAMADNYGRISRSQLSELLNYSGAYLNEISKKYSGLSLYDLGMTYCMKEVARLLVETSYSIADIEASFGFTNRTHFYKIFKETYGTTPARYKKSQQIKQLNNH